MITWCNPTALCSNFIWEKLTEFLYQVWSQFSIYYISYSQLEESLCETALVTEPSSHRSRRWIIWACIESWRNGLDWESHKKCGKFLYRSLALPPPSLHSSKKGTFYDAGMKKIIKKYMVFFLDVLRHLGCQIGEKIPFLSNLVLNLPLLRDDPGRKSSWKLQLICFEIRLKNS